LRILGLDLGTRTGYCYTTVSQREMGTWLLATPKEIRQWGKNRQTRTKDPRVERLCEKISGLGTFDVIVFEDVQFSVYAQQTQLWSSLRAAIWLCGRSPIIEAVPVTTLKKFATGSGAADKLAMARCFLTNPYFRNSPKLDDNGIDAAWLWLWAFTNLSRTKT